mmetsp:Transcript_1987/g.2691  ORF Transcript_1987/g.2691 Transcript_1987/m.2691 type:complete len:217 (+) Transcript_1987:1108-1758(+)
MLGAEVINQEEFMRVVNAIKGKSDGGSGAIHGNQRTSELLASHTHESVSRPDTADGTDSKVGVNDGRTIKRIECHGVARAAHRVFGWGLLGGGSGDGTARLQLLEQNGVSQDINGELLITKLVEAGHLVARGSTDLVSDLLTGVEKALGGLGKASLDLVGLQEILDGLIRLDGRHAKSIATGQGLGTKRSARDEGGHPGHKAQEGKRFVHHLGDLA